MAEKQAVFGVVKQFDKMYISGGRIGTMIALNPQDLAKVVRASFAPILAQ